MSDYVLIQGDCLESLKELPDNSVDSMITDPPAGISFMGKAWDEDKGGRKQWIAWMSSVMTEAMRVLKPGAHALVWAIPRTSHWTATSLEDAGFEIRDTILHCFGSGFPKSLNINKALEKDGRVCICEREENSDLRDMSEDVSTEVENGNSEIENLQLQMQGHIEVKSTRNSDTLKEHSIEHERQKGDTALRRGQPGLEGRGNLQTQQRELHRSEVRTMPKGIPANGQKGRLRNGAPSSNGNVIDENTNEDGSCPSQGPQHSKQSDRESGVVCEQQSPQTCGRCGKQKITSGLGTALKPAVEIWWLVRKPLSEKTVAANVLKHGCGGLNIDATRVSTGGKVVWKVLPTDKQHDSIFIYDKPGAGSDSMFKNKGDRQGTTMGRFPANLVLSHNEDCEDKCTPGCAVAELDAQSGYLPGAGNKRDKLKPSPGGYHGVTGEKNPNYYNDSGGASRFFYCAKASKSDKGTENTHPTVKSTKLMSYLIKLITPPGGVVLDPFTGSGSTGVSALQEGFDFIGIEKESEYYIIADSRLNNAKTKKKVA